MKNIIVQKFGGSALASLDLVRKAGDIVAFRKNHTDHLCVVVSAMGNYTDELISLARGLTEQPDKRELDALISCGENISAGLLTLYLQALGVPAKSLSGRQAGIFADSNYGNARIIRIYADLLHECFMKDQVAVIAGFQGYNELGEVVTLGRGGSDLTAVAIGAVIEAKLVEFLKDVNGVYDLDPHEHPTAKHFPFLDYSSALTIVRQNAHQVIYAPAITYAEEHQLTLRVVSTESFYDESQGTLIGLNNVMHKVVKA